MKTITKLQADDIIDIIAEVFDVDNSSVEIKISRVFKYAVGYENILEVEVTHENRAKRTT